jgi:hypothetical protein
LHWKNIPQQNKALMMFGFSFNDLAARPAISPAAQWLLKSGVAGDTMGYNWEYHGIFRYSLQQKT